MMSKVVRMNQATRLILAVLLVVASGGGIVLADVSSDFETLFGAEAKKVAASGIKSDDVAFAAFIWSLDIPCWTLDIEVMPFRIVFSPIYATPAG